MTKPDWLFLIGSRYVAFLYSPPSCTPVSAQPQGSIYPIRVPVYAMVIFEPSAARELLIEKLVDSSIAALRKSSAEIKILFIPYLPRSL
jgi:hypothetical protein